MLADTPLDELDNGSVIVIDERIVLGQVHRGRSSSGQVAETVIEAGPATVRAHEPLDDFSTEWPVATWRK